MSKTVEKLKVVFQYLASIIIPIFQYVPTASIWHGIMSIPLISYLIFFFQDPSIFQSDLSFFDFYFGTVIAFFGLGLYLYCLIYQLIHRKKLIQTGPYRIIRHPQYLSLIILISGLTAISFQTTPITISDPYDRYSYLIVFIIWIVEVLAYITLAKMEEISLKARYGQDFMKYIKKVPFMYPFLRLGKNRSLEREKKEKTIVDDLF
ncbi:MAG: hypothetical protein EU533_06520 [Promethearchaeota archaeon]|nr:MAG: hypothetical protein EU533_06520 [Candidatus Lokiarchaeota archaeon]